MSNSFARALCAIHTARPATARCPSCRGYFCGECVTEHSGKLICASCLESASSGGGAREKAKPAIHLLALLQFLLACVVCWVLFYYAAQVLAGIPDEFHDGTIWE